MTHLKFTKLICTIGPSCDKPSKLKKLIKEGMDVARLNLSHGDYHYHREVIKRIRKLSHRVAILLDTKGPEIRTAVLDEPIHLKKGEIIILTNKKTELARKAIHQTYNGLWKDVSKGNTILISDGMVQLRVVSKSKGEIKCKILSNCVLGSKKSLVVPHKKVNLPDLTKKDYKDIEFGLKYNVDFIALSFVTKHTTVLKVRRMIKKAGKNISIISKIEHPSAIENIDKIIKVSEGIMIARGDLGLNISVENVPMIQKRIIKKVNKVGKPVIVATQMLESMTTNLKPTRAEASDVANAILDGADAVMLSGETAGGDYPIEAVRTMVRIIKDVDAERPEKKMHVHEKYDIPETIAINVNQIARFLDVKAIITPTHSGFTPNLIAKYRPKIPIIALSTDERVSRKLDIVKGVFQFHSFKKKKRERFIDSLKMAIREGVVKREDLIVMTFNHKLTRHLRTTNCVEIMQMDELIVGHEY